ncbi:MAG: FKBP-type peptidyl-prolyl cis-trans isomerase [Prevotellaceae bacterium]|nr:FKBP-type peptidyl-prolyl cis-trans isomerase [Prevotellaceae bacterium]
MKYNRKNNARHAACVAALALAAALTGCAVQADENADENERLWLEAHVGIHYPNAQAKASGLYFIEIQPGAGTQPQSQDYVYVNYTAYDLSGNVLTGSSTANSNSDSIARQLGLFADSIYYGPRLWSIGHSSIYAGIEEALANMRVGGKARILMPSWLSTVGSSDRQLTTPTVFDIELLEVVSDITAYEKNALLTYNQNHYNVPSEDDDTWYFAELTPGTGEVAALNDTFHVRYVGYLLDGFVFDTNIADSASYHRIYNSSKTYATMTTVYTEEMGLVDGFKKALEKMKAGGEAVVFFSSALGYAETGSGQIQPYTPLCFYIRMERIGLAVSTD